MTTAPSYCSDGLFTAAEIVVPIATLMKPARRRWCDRLSLTATCLLVAGGLCMQFTPRQVLAAEQASGITQEQADAILQELRSMRELLEQLARQQARPVQAASSKPDTARVYANDRPALGAPDAPVTVVEFTDYECPFCKRFHQTTFKSLKRDYIDTGKVRWVVLDLPLPIHPNAGKTAQAAHCAGEQDKFWEMRAVLFDNAPTPNPESLASYGRQLGLDKQTFEDCLISDRYLSQIGNDSQAAAGNRITGTPTFIIGKSGGDRVEGKRIIGAQSYAVFDSAIRLVLSEPSTAPA